MPELIEFQTMVILDPNDMTFDAVVSLVWSFDFYLNLAHHTVGEEFKYLELIKLFKFE